MIFGKDHIYHIYNQGNNRQKIFFKRDNYLFFLKKIRQYIIPYADILAWCLMPNHFHLMVLLNNEELVLETDAVSGVRSEIVGVTRSDADNLQATKRSFNQSVGIMLRSYTRAINKQQNRTGKLFREKTKAECITCTDGITPSFYTVNGITQINVLKPAGEQYPQVCFDYIHNNPVAAGIVKNVTDWEFSSAQDFAGVRKGRLVNKNVAQKYIDFN